MMQLSNGIPKRVDMCEHFIVQIQSSFIFQIESIPFIHLLHTTMADIERGGKRESRGSA